MVQLGPHYGLSRERPPGLEAPDNLALVAATGTTDHLEGRPVLVGISVCGPGPRAHPEMGAASSMCRLRSVDIVCARGQLALSPTGLESFPRSPQHRQ